MAQALTVHHLSSLISSGRVSQPGTTNGSQSAASAPGFETRRSTARKEGHFVYKHGQRHHSYDSEKAPYPLCYDRSVLDLLVFRVVSIMVRLLNVAQQGILREPIHSTRQRLRLLHGH
jgi:hypothetical protein